MKKLLFITLLFISNLLYSQTIYQDVVYLKNGSKIKGVIIEQIPSVSLRIETTDGSVFVFKMEEIEKMTKEATLLKKDISSEQNIKSSEGLKKGYKGIIDIGYQIGIGDYGMDRLKFNFINGYQFNPNISIGLGLGLRYFIVDGTAYVPIFTDFRTTFLDNNISPYFSLGIGYSVTNGGGVGFFLNPNLGTSFKVSKRSAINLGIGYELQKMDLWFGNYYSGYYTETINLSVIDLHIGFSF
jgi:hypothetical protein